MELTDFIIAFSAAIAAGLVNALAGGGTLITFPVLVALGIPPIAANVTNTIALCPGYFGGTYAQRKDFLTQKHILWLILPVAIAGGIVGGILLLFTPEKSFRLLIPYLILAATIILALQGLLKTWLNERKNKATSEKTNNIPMLFMVFFAAVYGGYFGAGLGVILMAVLGLLINDTLTHLNALKQATSFCINISAAIYFCFSGIVVWPIVAVMVAGALGGGMLGGKLAGKINPEILRWIIIATGLTVAIVYFIQ
jgi:uncharacterized protein